MNVDLAEKDLGANGHLSLKMESGKLKLSVEYGGGGVSGSVGVSVDSDYFIDKLAAAIPGQIDDAILALIKAALKA